MTRSDISIFGISTQIFDWIEKEYKVRLHQRVFLQLVDFSFQQIGQGISQPIYFLRCKQLIVIFTIIDDFGQLSHPK